MIRPLALILALLSSPALAQVDRGGREIDYIAPAHALKHPLDLSACMSACTMRLANASCVGARTLFVFHKASNPVGEQMLLASYTPALAAYIQTADDMLAMTGSELRRYGYRTCGVRPAHSVIN